MLAPEHDKYEREAKGQEVVFPVCQQLYASLLTIEY
jgi:hypothetical protein